MSMKKSELKNLINEVIEEMSQDFYKDQLYLRATGPNQRAGGTSKWLKIRKIEDEGDSYAFFVIIRGEERSVGISKETIKSGKGTPNLEFQVRSMPATVNTVLHHYFSGNVNELQGHRGEGVEYMLYNNKDSESIAFGPIDYIAEILSDYLTQGHPEKMPIRGDLPSVKKAVRSHSDLTLLQVVV